MLPVLIPVRWCVRCVFVVCVLGAALPAWAESALSPEMVTLPDGQQVLIGDQAEMLLKAADSGRLEDVLRSLLDAGRWDDGLAVLIYVARHRPALTDGLMALGLVMLATAERAEEVGSILAAIAEAGNGDALSFKPSKVVVDAANAEDLSIDIASLEPASGPPERVDAPLVDPSIAPVTYGTAGGGGGGIGGGLPAGLFIGSSGGGTRQALGQQEPSNPDSVDPPVQPPTPNPDPIPNPNPDIVDPPADGGVS